MSLHYPLPKDLNTGDLLFPRVPNDGARSTALGVHGTLETLWNHVGRAWAERPLRELLGPDAVDMLEDETVHPDVGGLLATPTQPREQWLESLAAEDRARMEFAGREMLLLFILRTTLKKLVKDWLGMTVGEFWRHPLRRILLGALEPGGQAQFFIGHVAMVLRERDGAHADDGEVWVIEANITDFSHYGVAQHRYWVDGEPTGWTKPGDHGHDRMRGWANRRLAQGEAIWHSRLIPADADPARASQWRQHLVNRAKRYLGTPYGFFDDPEFGHTGRLYCGEFVQRVFTDTEADAAWHVDQNLWWAWLFKNLDALGPPDFVKEVDKALTLDLRRKMQGEPFFLLTLPMLYRSAQLLPIGPGGYA